MRGILPALIFAFSAASFAETADDPLIRVGDSVVAVRNHLGQPKIEVPLQGRLIQDYGDCIIISRNGVVTAIKNRTAPPLTGKEKDAAHEAAIVSALQTKAKNGDADAQYRLGYRFQLGQGVERNPEEALRWYTISAYQGCMEAQHNLGVMYLSGDGVDRDMEQAFMWAVLAAGNGNDTLLKALADRLTAEQEKAARARASEILQGDEKPPYSTPESSASSEPSSAIAQKEKAAEPDSTKKN